MAPASSAQQQPPNITLALGINDMTTPSTPVDDKQLQQQQSTVFLCFMNQQKKR